MRETDAIVLRTVDKADVGEFCAMMENAFAASESDAFDSDMDVDINRELMEAFDDPNAHVVWVVQDEKNIGGAIVDVDEETRRSMLVWFFIDPTLHGQGIGTKAWFAIERAWPETEVWELGTPYADKRNINFYVNKCGFHIVEYVNDYHRSVSALSGSCIDADKNYPNNSFRFEKVM